MRQSDQFLSREEAAAARDDFQKQADEWLSKIITSISAGAGAGLVTLATYIATKSPSFWPQWILLLAAAAFLTALAFAWSTMAAMFNQKTFSAHAYESLLDRWNFDQHFEPHLPKEEAIGFRSGFNNQQAAGHHHADKARENASRSLLKAVVFLTAGISMTFFAIVVDNADFSPVEDGIRSLGRWIYS